MTAARPERPTTSPTKRRRIQRSLTKMVSCSVTIDVHALVMRLIRHGGDFANPIGDADRMNSLDRTQPRKAAIVIASAVADAMAPPVEASERHEEEIGLDGEEPTRAARESPCRQVASARPAATDGRSDARPRPTTTGKAVAKPSVAKASRSVSTSGSSRIGWKADTTLGVHSRASRKPSWSDARSVGRAAAGGSAFRRASASLAENGLRIGVGRNQGVCANPASRGAEPRRPLDGDPGRLRK